jgi:hypothetical protein
VKLHRARCDAQVVGNVLVVVAANQLVEYLALTRAQGRQRLPQALDLLVGIGDGNSRQQRLLDPVHQFIVLKRLLQKIPGAIFDGGHRRAHVPMPGQKQHRPRTGQRLEALKRDQPRQWRHADIKQHHRMTPVGLPGPGLLQEGPAPVPGGRMVATGIEQPGQAVPDVRVVVNDVNGGSVHGGPRFR